MVTPGRNSELKKFLFFGDKFLSMILLGNTHNWTSLIIYNTGGASYLSFAIKNSTFCACSSWHCDDFAGFIELREISRDAYKFAMWTKSKALWPPIALTKSIWAEVFRLFLPSCSFDGSDYIFVVLIQFQSIWILCILLCQTSVYMFRSSVTASWFWQKNWFINAWFLLWFFTLEYGTDRLSRNVGKIITNPRCVIAPKNAVLINQLFSIVMKTEAIL